MRLNKGVVRYTLKSHDPNDKKINHSFSSTQAEIDIFRTNPSVTVPWSHFQPLTHSTKPVTQLFYIKQTNAKSLKEKIKLNFGKAEVLEETQKFTARISLTELIQTTLNDSIWIQLDSIKRATIQPSEILYDTIKEQYHLKRPFRKKDSIVWRKPNSLSETGLSFPYMVIQQNAPQEASH